MQLTIREAAKILGTPEKQVYRWIEEGQIPFHRVHEQLRFNRAELLEWATARRMKVSTELFRDSGDTEAAPSLAAALELGGVHDQVGGTDREGVLRAVVGAMPFPSQADREMLLQVLLARESMGSTAIGEGLAIPHVRNPVVLHGAPASVTLCYLEHPVEFGAVDKQPVHTIFSIVTSTIRGHLQLLGRLSWALLDPGFRAAVLARKPSAEIIQQARRLEATSAPPESGGGT